jgi:hypothetical protein
VPVPPGRRRRTASSQAYVGSQGRRRSRPRQGSAEPSPTRWLVGDGKKAGREGGGASGQGSSHAGWSVGAPAPAGSTPPRQPPGRPHRPSPGLPSIARGVTRARAAASRGWPAAPAGARGPIEPRSSCRSSRPSRGRRHRRRGTSRTDGDTQARRPRDLAYLWVVEHGGAGSRSRPCETTACSAAAGCRVDRLRPDKPGRLHRSRPQARAQRVRPASAGVLAPARGRYPFRSM